MGAPLGQDRLDAVLLTERLAVADELDHAAVFCGDSFRVLADPLAQHFRELGEVEDPIVALGELGENRCVYVLNAPPGSA